MQCHNEQSVSVPDCCGIGNKIGGDFAGLFTLCIELADQLIRPQMCISLQHVERAMAGNGRNLHDVGCAEFKKSG